MTIKNSILFLTIALASLFTCCQRSAITSANTSNTSGISIDSIPSLMGENINTLVTDSGKMSYRMMAPKLSIFDKVDSPYWDFPEGVHMTTFAENGNDNGEIQSKFAIYYVEKDLWELRNQVVANNPDGKKIETELHYWDQEKKEIYSDDFVTITEDVMITKGTGFKSDEAFEEWSLDDFEIEYIEE